MLYKTLLLINSFILSIISLHAEAKLSAYVATGNIPVVYSSISDITWTADANILGTMMNIHGYDNVINAIITASPAVTSTTTYRSEFDPIPFIGEHHINTNDFHSINYGKATWFGAMAFTNYLNSINYGGSNRWSLPSAGTDPFNKFDGQFGQLYYNELKLGNENEFTSTDPFLQIPLGDYWLSNEAFAFDFHDGSQFAWDFLNYHYNAWAISPGQLAVIPVPSAIWLFSSGLLLLFNIKRSKHDS